MTFVDVLNNVGGLMSIIVVFAVVLIQYLQEIIYYTNLVKSMFLYQEEENDQKLAQNKKNKKFVSTAQIDFLAQEEEINATRLPALPK